jgi:hypothetical protein
MSEKNGYEFVPSLVLLDFYEEIALALGRTSKDSDHVDWLKNKKQILKNELLRRLEAKSES